MATFYSRYKNYMIGGAPVVGTVDFSGGKEPPQDGDGLYVTSDATLISWLRAHEAYGIDFAETPFVEAGPPPKVYTREELLSLLIDSIAVL